MRRWRWKSRLRRMRRCRRMRRWSRTRRCRRTRRWRWTVDKDVKVEAVDELEVVNEV